MRGTQLLKEWAVVLKLIGALCTIGIALMYTGKLKSGPLSILCLPLF